LRRWLDERGVYSLKQRKRLDANPILAIKLPSGALVHVQQAQGHDELLHLSVLYDFGKDKPFLQNLNQSQWNLISLAMHESILSTNGKLRFVSRESFQIDQELPLEGLDEFTFILALDSLELLSEVALNTYVRERDELKKR
jgi:hypothetical protein